MDEINKKMNIQKIKKELFNAWNNQPNLCLFLGFMVVLGVWLGVIFPIIDANKKQQEVLLTAQEELTTIQGWANQIKTLQKNLSAEQLAGNTESLLQQVERIGKESKVFHKISRISPSKVRSNGREYEGISLEYEKTSMAELAPFLDAITYKSILNIHEITVQKYADEDGIVSARMVLVGN